MNITEARSIYANPKGHSRDGLVECLRILNESAQPIELSNVQFKAILDAHRILGLSFRKLINRGASFLRIENQGG